MLKELTADEFQSTTTENMRLLGEDDQTCAGFPLVSYVEQWIGTMGMAVDVDDFEFHFAYMNDENRMCHVGLNFGDPDFYLVIVLDVSGGVIVGHTILDVSRRKHR
jgi:hypothetical protein